MHNAKGHLTGHLRFCYDPASSSNFSAEVSELGRAQNFTPINLLGVAGPNDVLEVAGVAVKAPTDEHTIADDGSGNLLITADATGRIHLNGSDLRLETSSNLKLRVLTSEIVSYTKIRPSTTGITLGDSSNRWDQLFLDAQGIDLDGHTITSTLGDLEITPASGGEVRVVGTIRTPLITHDGISDSQIGINSNRLMLHKRGIQVGGGRVALQTGGVYGFGTANADSTGLNSVDGGLSKVDASTIGIGDGTAGDASRDLALRNLTASGVFSQQTSTTADPTTTEYTTDQDWGVHKNTTSGNVFLAYNDGGTIKKVQLT